MATKQKTATEPSPYQPKLVRPKRNCATCAAWRQREMNQGECHRHAPRPVLAGEVSMLTRPDAHIIVWPLTYGVDTCDEHHGKETP